MTYPIRVLVVDDSAFARKVIREVLSRDKDIEVVGIARDGLEALEKIAQLKPDVITLDLVMPDLDGLGVLRALAKTDSPRVIVVSSSASNSDLAIEALQSGAVDMVTKTTPLPTDRLYELSDELVLKVKAAATARLRGASFLDDSVQKIPNAAGSPTTTRLVVIGTSTGGPQALTTLFKSLPEYLPVPVVIALHIPSGYTAPLAARLSKLGSVSVTEAENGMELRPGHAYLAPGGLHLRIREINNKFYAEISQDPLGLAHRPSVDELFTSAQRAAGAGVLSVVMTGMGNDGFKGTQDIRAGGGRVLAESASSCIVYGMPRCVIEGQTANFEAPLEKLGKLIVEEIYK